MPARRLAQFGPSPSAYLLGASDFAAERARCALSASEPWFGRQAA